MLHQSVNHDYENMDWTLCKEQSPLYKEQGNTRGIRGKEVTAPLFQARVAEEKRACLGCPR